MLTEIEKRDIHQTAQQHVSETCERLHDKAQTEGDALKQLRVLLRQPSGPDRLVQQALLPMREAAFEQTTLLSDSPYFVSCTIQFKGEEPSVFYFAKFSRTDEQIFSWISPIASIRYEPLGNVAYKLPDGTEREGIMTKRDQFMIVKRQILFLASEATDYERTLIYQDYFSRRKSSFTLTDIVAQMEQAQDAVIRAPSKGPLLLSGPAGSGKTTLALHRLAYLAQSPETSEQFTATSMLVLVQDASSKAYFSELLPSLGIHNVTIETFSDWALSILPNVTSVIVQDLHTTDRAAQERYEFEKRTFLRQSSPMLQSQESPWSYLSRCYRSNFSPTSLSLWNEQKAKHTLDRFDLTLLLVGLKARFGRILKERTVTTRTTRGILKEQVRQELMRYSTIILDEVQNYLPTQIELIRSCIDPNTRAMVYVGDLAQQTKIGTIRDWREVGEELLDSQRVLLRTVYRNSRQILEYIQSRGYQVSIPEKASEGPTVEHRSADSSDRALAELTAWLSRRSADQGILGVLVPTELLRQKVIAQLGERVQVQIMTFQMAQGVEFADVVILLPSDWNTSVDQRMEDAWKEELARIRKDLLYVALTRAMNQLIVIEFN